MRPRLPTEALLAAAAAAAQEAKQKALETAQPNQAFTAHPDQASPASLAELAQPDTPQGTHHMVKTDPPAQTDPIAKTDRIAKTAAVTEPSAGAVSPTRAVTTALEGSSAGGAPNAMDTDMPDVTHAPDSEPEAVKAEAAAQSAESDRQPNAELPHSDLEMSVPVPTCPVG